MANKSDLITNQITLHVLAILEKALQEFEDYLVVQRQRHGGNNPPLLTKVIFVNRLKLMRKYWWNGG